MKRSLSLILSAAIWLATNLALPDTHAVGLSLNCSVNGSPSMATLNKKEAEGGTLDMVLTVETLAPEAVEECKKGDRICNFEILTFVKNSNGEAEPFDREPTAEERESFFRQRVQGDEVLVESAKPGEKNNIKVELLNHKRVHRIEIRHQQRAKGLDRLLKTNRYEILCWQM